MINFTNEYNSAVILNRDLAANAICPRNQNFNQEKDFLIKKKSSLNYPQKHFVPPQI